MLEKPNEKYRAGTKLVILGLFFIVAITLFYLSIFVVVLSLIGIGIGVLLAPILSFLLRKYRIPRTLSALLCLLVIILILGGAGWGLWYLVDDQARSFSKKIPEITIDLNIRLETILAKYPWLRNEIESLNFGDSAKNLAQYALPSNSQS